MATTPIPEDLLMQLAQAGMGGDNWQYLGMDDSSPYGKVRNRAALLKDIEGLTGVPFTQLSGVGPDPAETPAPSRVAAMYGTNPNLSKAFEAIDSGTDPLTIRAAYETSIKDGKAPKEGEPGYVDPESFTKIVSDYATEKFDAAQTASKTDESFTLADGSKAKNIPLGGRDVYGRAAEYDLWGAPTADEMRQIVEQQRNDLLRPGAQRVLAGQRSAGPATANSLVNSRRNRSNPTSAQGAMGSWDSMPENQRQYYNKTRDRAIGQKITEAQGNMVRSDANNAAMQRLMALRTMLGG